MRSRSNSWALALWLFGLFGAGLSVAQDTRTNLRTNPRAGIDFYLQTYGRVTPADAPDVYAVFERVRAAADKSSLVTPQLVIVGDAKQASAFALSDGTIFLSKKALAIIREAASGDQAQARLAFVLGHELAHLANNDFWDNQISQALLESSTAKELAAGQLEGVVDTSAGQQRKELKADDLGFVYAALAGYNVDGLLQSTGNNEDFLNFWNAKAGKRNDPNYPLAAQRTSLLRLRLSEMRDALQSFEFGSRLMHFGRYREAMNLFREFQKQFPGREVFNNMGYCSLRMAAAQLDPEYAYRYWLPTMTELHSPLAKMTHTTRSAENAGDRKQWRMPPAAREGLLQSVRYFELAIDKDAAYGPSYINLAVAQLLLGMDSGSARLAAIDGSNLLRAKIAVESALKLQPDNAQVRMLGAIIDFEIQNAEKPGHAPTATDFQSSDPAVLYNAAQLTSGEPEKSAAYWRRLAAQFDAVPKRLQMLACQRPQKGTELKAACEGIAANSTLAKLPWTLPVKLSRDLLESPFTDSEVSQNNWRKQKLDTGAAYVGPSSSALAIDDIVTLVVMKRPATADSLVQCCSQPLEKISVVDGTLWHYGRWIALLRNRTVEEVWVSN